MTSAEKTAKIETLQTEAKDYQAELGFIAVQRRNAERREAALEALLAEGERRFHTLKDAQTEEPAKPTEAPSDA